MAQMAIRAGELRHALVIQTLTKTRSGLDVVEDWTVGPVPVRGGIKELSGRELETAKSTDNRATHEVKIRFNSAVDSKKRFLFGSKIFNIANVNNVDERSVWMKILVFENKP